MTALLATSPVMPDSTVRPGWGQNTDYLSKPVFDELASFMHQMTGIALSQAKKTMVEGRLRRHVNPAGSASLDDYVLSVIEGACRPGEQIRMIDALTTNKTDFFRENRHFEFLAETAFPEILSLRHSARIWSAACSIGAEPYTLAMVAADFARRHPGFQYSILASDLSTKALDKARRAVYPDDMIEPIPQAMRHAYLLRSRNRAQGLFKIRPELRAAVSFLQVNLVEQPFPVERALDVVLCRNVLIYFDRPTQEKVVRSLAEHVRPGGYLILGHTDSLTGLSVPLRPMGNSIYRREA